MASFIHSEVDTGRPSLSRSVYGQWVRKEWKVESKHSAMQTMVPVGIIGSNQTGNKHYAMHAMKISRRSAKVCRTVCADLSTV